MEVCNEKKLSRLSYFSEYSTIKCRDFGVKRLGFGSLFSHLSVD